MTNCNDLFKTVLTSLTSRQEIRQLVIRNRCIKKSVILTEEKAGSDRGGYFDFSSNDYLGLSHHPLLIERSIEWTQSHGVGTGGSRLVTGTSSLHIRVEEKLAAFLNRPRAILFATGWQANVTVLGALIGLAREQKRTEPLVFVDRLVHASLYVACREAGVRPVRFRHNDLDHLEHLLMKKSSLNPVRIIVVESLYSMDGDYCPMERLLPLAQRHGVLLYVDDAHTTGVIGKNGRGHAAMYDGIDVLMGTFSKAMGSFGAFVAGSSLLCEWIVNRCSGFIYSTAPPPSLLGAMDAAIELVPSLAESRKILTNNRQFLYRKLSALGVDCGSGQSHIIPLICGSAEAALALQNKLLAHRILAIAIRPPTVPPKKSRLRLTVSAKHQPFMLETLVASIKNSL